MQVKYDKSIKIAGIGVFASARYGLNLWFNNSKIVSLFNDPDFPSLSFEKYLKAPYDGKRSTQALLYDSRFQDMLIKELKGYHVLTYKPVEVPSRLVSSGVNFISGSKSMVQISSKFENKAWFRRKFLNSGINIPRHKIYKWQDLKTDEDFYNNLRGNREIFVIQDAVLSGGKGTSIVKDFEDYKATVESAYNAQGEVVVSDFVSNSQDMSIQGVVTRYGIFIGPAHRQIVAHPQLLDPSIKGSDLFCGVEIRNSDQNSTVHQKLTKNAKIIGEELQKSGYCGIFGVDSLVSGNEVHTIEVNPRITGATPLLTVNYKEGAHVPFYLLHMLELLDANYEIKDVSRSNEYSDCSLVIPRLLGGAGSPGRMKGLRTGLYDEKLRRGGDFLGAGDEMSGKRLVFSYKPSPWKPNGSQKIASIFLWENALDSNGNIVNSVQEVIEKITEPLG